MFGIGKIWVYVIAVAALVAAVAFGVSSIYNAGYNARDAVAAADSAEAGRMAEKVTGELRAELAASHEAHDKGRSDAKIEIDSLRARLADRTLRLHAPVVIAAGDRGSPAAADPKAGAQSDPAPSQSAAGEHPQLSVELDPATALELLSITADGDAAIRDLNECVDSYETLRKKLNGLKRID